MQLAHVLALLALCPVAAQKNDTNTTTGADTPPYGTVTGGSCNTLYWDGQKSCDDVEAACQSGSECQAIMNRFFEVCPTNHFAWNEEEMEWENTTESVADFSRSMEVMCSPCGSAFMGFSAQMEEQEDECGATMCQQGSTCNGLLATLNATCTSDHVFPGAGEEEDEDYPIRDMVDQMMMGCSPCGSAMMSIDYVCNEQNACEEVGSCAVAKAAIFESCPPEAEFDGTSVSEMMRGLEMMCGACMQSIQEWGATCGDDSGRSAEVCEDDTECSGIFWGMQVSCRPAEDACSSEENYCGCMMMQHDKYCEEYCNEDSCPCEMDCGMKSLADMMLFSLMQCEDGSGSRGCSTIPASHEMWRSDFWASHQPKRCEKVVDF